MPLPNTVTTIIAHPNNPNNVIAMPKQQQPKRLLVMIGRKEHNTFSDEPGSPMGQGFWVSGFSQVHWDFIRSKANANWMFKNGHKYTFNAHAWLDGLFSYTDKIHQFMLEQLNMDPNKYHVMTWSTHNLKPIPTLHEIQP